MADESKPQVVAVRTGVGIDSRQKIPYFVGVSEATTRCTRALSTIRNHSTRRRGSAPYSSRL